MHILFYEQATCKRGTKMEKGLLKVKCILTVLWQGEETISLLFKERR